MQDSENILFNQTEESDIPSWKPIDDALRAMTTLRLHNEQMEQYQNLKDQYQ